MTTARPIRAITLLPGGRCGCTACVNDARKADAEKDVALAQVVYELGLVQLRAAALERVPAFTDAFRTVA